MCDLCGSKHITFQDEFQLLCQKCHIIEQQKEIEYFKDIIIW